MIWTEAFLVFPLCQLFSPLAGFPWRRRGAFSRGPRALRHSPGPLPLSREGQSPRGASSAGRGSWWGLFKADGTRWGDAVIQNEPINYSCWWTAGALRGDEEGADDRIWFDRCSLSSLSLRSESWNVIRWHGRELFWQTVKWRILGGEGELSAELAAISFQMLLEMFIFSR